MTLVLIRRQFTEYYVKICPKGRFVVILLCPVLGHWWCDCVDSAKYITKTAVKSKIMGICDWWWNMMFLMWFCNQAPKCWMEIARLTTKLQLQKSELKIVLNSYNSKDVIHHGSGCNSCWMLLGCFGTFVGITIIISIQNPRCWKANQVIKHNQQSQWFSQHYLCFLQIEHVLMTSVASCSRLTTQIILFK